MSNCIDETDVIYYGIDACLERNSFQYRVYLKKSTSVHITNPLLLFVLATAKHCETRMHSSRMRAVRSSSHLSRRGDSASVHAGIPTPQTRPPWEQAPPPEQTHPHSLEQGPPDPTPQDQASPQSRYPPDQAPPPSPRGQTHACENITFAASLRTVIIAKEYSINHECWIFYG